MTMGESESGPRIVTRMVDEQACERLIGQHIHPVMARIYAARGIDSNDDLDTSLGSLLPTDTLQRCGEAAELLADAIIDKQPMLIVADYDADGATACALGLSVLRQLGAEITYLVPNRFEHGYGLTPEIVDIAASWSPQLIITVVFFLWPAGQALKQSVMLEDAYRPAVSRSSPARRTGN